MFLRFHLIFEYIIKLMRLEMDGEHKKNEKYGEEDEER